MGCIDPVTMTHGRVLGQEPASGRRSQEFGYLVINRFGQGKLLSLGTRVRHRKFKTVNIETQNLESKLETKD